MTNDLPERRPLRLQEYDYGQAGAYFVTICTHDRECLFGEIVGETMQCNGLGEILAKDWIALPVHFARVSVSDFVVMPNHFHGILFLNEGEEIAQAGQASLTPTTLPIVIGSFKAGVSRQINTRRETPGAKVWQRGYYEHIIRNEADLARIQQYIADNLLKWAMDEDNPATKR